MACIGLTWELGSFSGYAAVMRQIVMAAARDSHRCVAIVRDLHVSTPLLAELPTLTLLQAPVSTPSRTPAVAVQTTYATLLHNCGFADADALAARVNAWRALFRAFGIERVLARHSPTAVLAARTLGIPILHYGTGFSVPPQRSPWPPFHPDIATDDPRLLANEQRVLAATNAALHRLGVEELPRMASLYANLPTALISYAELDHYQRPEPVPFLGLPRTSYGAAPAWPADTRRPRLFVSLPVDRGTRGWIDTLAQLPVTALLRFNGPAVQFTDLPPQFAIADGAVDFTRAIAECDAVIGYGSHNLVCEALLAGKPMALIAKNPDHLLTGARLTALGAGIVLPDQPGPDSCARLRAMFADPGHASAAGRFAERYGSKPRERIADILLELALTAETN
jgi:UDP:flavonoid glycosyltransferase YjiC (YdhE family)